MEGDGRSSNFTADPDSLTNALIEAGVSTQDLIDLFGMDWTNHLVSPEGIVFVIDLNGLNNGAIVGPDGKVIPVKTKPGARTSSVSTTEVVTGKEDILQKVNWFYTGDGYGDGEADVWKEEATKPLKGPYNGSKTYAAHDPKALWGSKPNKFSMDYSEPDAIKMNYQITAHICTVEEYVVYTTTTIYEDGVEVSSSTTKSGPFYRFAGHSDSKADTSYNANVHKPKYDANLPIDLTTETAKSGGYKTSNHGEKTSSAGSTGKCAISIVDKSNRAKGEIFDLVDNNTPVKFSINWNGTWFNCNTENVNLSDRGWTGDGDSDICWDR